MGWRDEMSLKAEMAICFVHTWRLRLRQRHHQINIDTENGFRPILCVCVTIDAMLNFDGSVDANADVKCEHSFTVLFPLLSLISGDHTDGVPMSLKLVPDYCKR